MPIKAMGTAQSMVSSMMNQANAARQPKGGNTGQETPEQKLWKSQIEKAINSGDHNLALDLIRDAEENNAGIPIQPYISVVQRSNPLISVISNLLNPRDPGGKSPFERTDVAMNAPESWNQTTDTQAKAKGIIADLFTPEFLARTATKQATGIDVGETTQDPEWFADYAEIKRAYPQMTATEIKTSLAQKWGYIPQTAAQLKDLSLDERKSITQGIILKNMQDPELAKAVQKSFPNSDPDKTKMVFILNQLNSEGYPIPDSYLPFLERAADLSDEMVQFKADEKAALEAATTGSRIGAEYANRGMSAATKAAETSATTKASKQAEYSMEADKPISAEDRAKYGIGAFIPTYTELANQGFRFPTEADRKMYAELSAVRDQIQNMQDLLFSKDSGVFIGVGDDWVSRKTSQAELLKERATGSLKGQNYEIYADTLASMARRLLTLAGESGGRFTDKDVEQIVRSAPDLGGVIGPIDSQAIAERKFERFIMSLNRRLADITGSAVVKPTGQPGEGQSVQPEGGKVKLETGKVYRDAQGNRAKYLGNDEKGDPKWEMIK